MYAEVYPGVNRDGWYKVLPYDGKFGAYIDLDGVPRFVSREHFEIVDLEAR